MIRAWFKEHLVDGLDRGDNWLSCMRRKDGHLRPLCGPMMGRETHQEERRLRSPRWMGGARLSYGPHDGKRECAREERRLWSLCWMGGNVQRQLFVIHAKEERTKTSVVVEINTSTYAAQT
jgi:hypothetical protein